MPRTDAGAAINARTAPTVAYGPDPRGWRFFTALAGVLQRGHNGRDGVRVVDTQRTFTGAIATAPQSFSGMAGLGGGRPVSRDTSVLSDERAAGALDDSALRIFAERLRRGGR